MRRRTNIARSVVPALGALATLATLAAGAAGAARERSTDDNGRRPERDQANVEEGHSKSSESKPGWVDGGFGWEHLDMTTISANRNPAGDVLTADLIPRVVDGPTAHLGVGVRFRPLTLGLRAGVAAFQDTSATRSVNDMQFYSIDAELGMRIPLERFEPYLLVAGGYSVFGGLGDAIRGAGRGLAVDGANVRAGLGLDFYVSPLLSLGARFTGEVLFLSRAGVPIRDLATAQQVNTMNEAKARLLEGDGSSIGTALNLTVGPGLHF